MAYRADSPASSDLSEPPSNESEPEDHLSSAVPSSRPSVDVSHSRDIEHLAPPAKRRKTGPVSRAPSEHPPSVLDHEDDNISLSSDGWSDAPGSPTHDEYALREEAQTMCLWRDCPFGQALNNDDLVEHVQSTHCAPGGPKKTKYVCEWGECQRKTSNHPSGYALKAHMRSHTKEKPYYCALPECDKAFTRSDALAKHMRTVHEPEQPKGATTSTANEPTPPGKKGVKTKLTNGTSAIGKAPTSADGASLGPTHDEDGNEIVPSPANDNITYIPAHHPITGQPGFMIHYPPDIQFTSWESAIAADQLMRLLRRQLHWAQKEQEQLKRENEELEQKRREEWTLKEILLDGVMEAELATADRDDLLRNVDQQVRQTMERDVQPAKQLVWTPSTPYWRRDRPPTYPYPTHGHPYNPAMENTKYEGRRPSYDIATPDQGQYDNSPSPPPTGHSAGFDGEGQPYDNYLADRMAEMERLRAGRERARSMQNTPLEQQADAEADAVGALMGMSGGKA